MGNILRWKKNYKEKGHYRHGTKGRFYIENNSSAKYVLENYPTEAIALIPSLTRISTSFRRTNLTKKELLKILGDYRREMVLAINNIKHVEEIIFKNY